MRHFLVSFLLVASAAFLLSSSGPAHAQTRIFCGMYDRFAQELESRYGETRHGTGVLLDGRRIELLESRERQTWTMLIVSGQGTACMVAVGLSWQDEPRGIPASFPTELPWGQLRWTWRSR